MKTQTMIDSGVISVHVDTPIPQPGELIHGVCLAARLLGLSRVHLYVPTDVLPDLAREAYQQSELPPVFQIHEMGPGHVPDYPGSTELGLGALVKLSRAASRVKVG
ncbi:hypothetical protein GP475_00780 [Corynebacterium poyangense]|uniref:Universal stress protein n=1 Tax=Corynebacterium poyangense TaxID=2684405 RepID=A0A7H0SLA3_9CORY|nr:hypothetical protein [Corynebacterium poyangense]QNQ89328.1 hypothetical protein GP475_00780 [Corynebacterium poyangense]